MQAVFVNVEGTSHEVILLTKGGIIVRDPGEKYYFNPDTQRAQNRYEKKGGQVVNFPDGMLEIVVDEGTKYWKSSGGKQRGFPKPTATFEMLARELFEYAKAQQMV
ncbi:MAG: hypothetical protein QW548_00335 [Candidatus Aenigmatarchaeota archaeon]